MPVVMIERRYAELMEPTPEGVAEINEINADEEVRWLMSFISADKRKSYCLYEADSADALMRVRPDGSMETVADGLDQPTSMQFIGHTAYVVTLNGEIDAISLHR